MSQLLLSFIMKRYYFALFTLSIIFLFKLSFLFTFFHQSTSTMPAKMSYSLRFPPQLKLCGSEGLFNCTWQLSRLFPENIFSNRVWAFYNSCPCYYREGFLTLQNTLAEAFIKSHGSTKEIPEIRLQQMPYPPHVSSFLLFYLPYLIPIIFLVSFNYAFINSVRYISIEKEKQLKEAMKIMGLSNWMQNLSWFLRSMAMLSIPITIIAAAFLVLLFATCMSSISLKVS